jgi:hypothetical protein
MFHDYGPSNDYEDGWLITPGIFVEDEGVYTVEFYSYNMWTNFYDKNSVWISYEGSNPEEDAFSLIWEAEQVGQNWNDEQAYFFASEQDTVYLAFRYQGSNAHSWYLDDMTLAEFGTTGQYLLMVTTNNTNGGSTTGYGLYNAGEQATVTATPSEGYEFLYWTDINGEIVSNDSEYVFQMPDNHYIIQANFDIAENTHWEENVKLTVFPNPARENVKILSSDLMESLSLLNQNGKIVRQIDLLGAFEHTIYLNDLNPGLYFIIIQTPERSIVRKVQVVR